MTDTQSADHVTVDYVAYDQIIADLDNVRSVLTDINQLADSIWAAGLINPLTVRPNGDGRFHLTAGYRRHAAIGYLLKEGRWTGPVPVLVRTDEDDESRLVAMIVENLQRVDVNPVDEALGIQRLIIEHSFSLEDVALNLGISEKVVKTRLALCQLTDLALASVRDGSLSVEAGVLLSRAPTKVQDKIAKGNEYDKSVSRVKTQIDTAAASVFAKEVKTVLIERGIPIDKDGYNTPKGYERGNAETFTQAHKVGEWISTAGVAQDDLVRISSHYQEPKVTLTHYKKLTEKSIAKQDAEQVKRDVENEKRHQEAEKSRDEQLAQRLDPEVYEWYSLCRTIAGEVERSEQLAGEVSHEHRAGFTRKLGTAQLAAAALRWHAIQTANTCARAFQYPGSMNSTAEFYLAVLEIDEAKAAKLGTQAPTWQDHIISNKQLTTRAAAAHLMQMDGRYTNAPDLEQAFTEALVEAGHIPEVVTFPVAPQSLNDKIVAAQGETFEQANASDGITFEAIEWMIESLVEGEFDVEPEQQEAVDADA